MRQISRDTLRIVLNDQRQERALIVDGAVPRQAMSAARQKLARPGALVVTGVRRCGKSTLCHQLLQDTDYLYVNFDDERLAALRASDLQTVLEVATSLQPNSKVLLLDEVQNVPKWELFVNRLLRAGYRLVVTGSNSRLLSRELATHLTGRHQSLELFPFSYREVLRARDIAADDDSSRGRALRERELDAYLRQGGFPQQVVHGFVAAELRELYDRIVSRDVVFRRRLRNPAVIRELSLLALAYSGQLFTCKKLARALGLKGITTTKNYLAYLEEAYLVASVQPYAAKPREQVRLPRKLYAIDNGLLSALNTKPTRDDGLYLETLVYQELRRRGAQIWTYRSGHSEVDFLLRETTRVSALVSVCWSLHHPDTERRELQGLFEAARVTRCKELTLITRDEKREVSRDGRTVRIVPVGEWLCEEV
jgi:predicted AAA+ superfamily ATPase